MKIPREIEARLLRTQTAGCLMEHYARSQNTREPAEVAALDACAPVAGSQCYHQYLSEGTLVRCPYPAEQTGQYPTGWLCIRHNLDVLRRQST